MPTRRELARRPCTERFLTLIFTAGAFVTMGLTLKDWFLSTAFQEDENGNIVISQRQLDEYLAITALTNMVMGGVMLGLLTTSITIGCIEEPGKVKLPPILATNGVVPIGITYSVVLASGVLISLASADTSTDETDPRLSAGLMLIILGISLRIALLSAISSPENQAPWVKTANRYLDVVGKLIEVAKFQGVVGLLISNDESGFLFYVISRMVFLILPPALGSYFHILAHCNANHHKDKEDFKTTPFWRSLSYGIINTLKAIAALMLVGVIFGEDYDTRLGWFTAAQVCSILSDCLETVSAFLQYVAPYWELKPEVAGRVLGELAGLATPMPNTATGAASAPSVSTTLDEEAARPRRRLEADKTGGGATLFWDDHSKHLTSDQIEKLLELD